MPRVTRSRTIAAPADRIWDLVSDPHSLPRWWPRVTRVEDVTGTGKRARWTAVLGTERGSGVRADFRCLAANSGERFAWSQDVKGTPFERILKDSFMEVSIEPDGPRSARVELVSDEKLRGLSRLGSQMMKGAARRRLDEALDGIELAVAEKGVT